jgi:hypothetical protein
MPSRRFASEPALCSLWAIGAGARVISAGSRQGRTKFYLQKLVLRDIFQGKLRHYPSQATQDRRSGSCQRPAHQIRTGLKLSSCRCVGACRQPSQRRCEPARLARLTRAVAARNNRGITPGPPRSIVCCHPQPR